MSLFKKHTPPAHGRCQVEPCQQFYSNDMEGKRGRSQFLKKVVLGKAWDIQCEQQACPGGRGRRPSLPLSLLRIRNPGREPCGWLGHHRSIQVHCLLPDMDRAPPGIPTLRHGTQWLFRTLLMCQRIRKPFSKINIRNFIFLESRVQNLELC